MQALFLVAFLTGLLLAVFAMLHGVERGGASRVDRGSPGAIATRPSAPAAKLDLPLIAAFAAVFGLTGYLLTRYTTLSAIWRTGIAMVVGALGALGALALVAKWAIPSALREPVDERYALQGHLARVTRPIEAARAGTIVYEIDGTSHAATASCVDGSALETGTEVVIERVEDGVAYVEAWAHVEKRL